MGRVGTPLYLSPEVVKSQPYDYKVDTWAVGCCLFHLAALEPPFIGENLQQLGAKIITDKPKPIPTMYSERLKNFITDTFLQKEANQRLYINQILKKASKYFSEDTIKKYREEVLQLLKARA